MGTLQYVGRPPDTDGSVVPKSYADAAYASQAVTTTVVNQKVATAALNLTTQAYVDQQDALRAHKTDVTAADLLYVNATEVGQPNGVAGLDSSGFIPSAQMPAGIITDRVAKCYSVVSPAGALGGTPAGTAGAVGSVQISSQHTVISTSPREYQLATITVPDPGFPYRVWPFAWVQGKSGGTSIDRSVGNSNYGLLTVMAPPGNTTVYAAGVCTASPFFDMFPVFPYAAAGATPTSTPSINGTQEFRLYGSCWSGNNFVFSPTNLIYFILVYPAM